MSSTTKIIAACSGLFLIVVAAIVMLVVKSNPVSTTPSETQSTSDQPVDNTQNTPDVAALQTRSNDVARKNDVGRLLAAVSEFESNNNGVLPSEWKDGNLVSSDGSMTEPVVLSFYKTVAVKQGASTAVSSDDLGLSLAAKCGPNGTTVAATSRAVAAQYHNSSGPQCVDL